MRLNQQVVMTLLSTNYMLITDLSIQSLLRYRDIQSQEVMPQHCLRLP